MRKSTLVLRIDLLAIVQSSLDQAIFYTRCAKINYACSTCHDKSYTRPNLKIYKSIFSKDPEIDASIFCIFFSLLFIKL